MFFRLGCISISWRIAQTNYKKQKKRAIYFGLRDNIWGADLADMQLTSKFSKGVRFLLCVINIFSEYVWVVSLKDKKKVLVLLMLLKKS